MRNALFALASLLTLAACQGPAGSDGAPGKNGTFTRTPSYCNTIAFAVDNTSGWSGSAPCNNQLDMPLSGDCFEPNGLPTGAVFIGADPVNWGSTTAIAAWKCKWAWLPGSTEVGFLGKSEICCSTP
jgi:hypothetical protein